MGGDCEVHPAVDVLFGEVDVLLGRGVDDVDVDALTVAGTDGDGDDDQGVWVGCAPYALCDEFSQRRG